MVLVMGVCDGYGVGDAVMVLVIRVIGGNGVEYTLWKTMSLTI